MKILGIMLLCGGGLLFAAVNLCKTPGCGHPRWAHLKSGQCGYDLCTGFRNK